MTDSEIKPRQDLIPTDALAAMGRVLGFGAIKHGAETWRQGRIYSEDYAAALRHIVKWWAGEDLDDETGESHLAHAMCRLAMLHEYTESGKFDSFDDRKNVSRFSRRLRRTRSKP